MQITSLFFYALLVFAQQAKKQPLTIVIAGKSTVAAGSDVWIEVFLTDSSNQSLDESGSFSDRTGLDPNFQFEVRDDQGNLVSKRSYAHPELTTGRQVNRTVGPGETVSQQQRVSAMYDMSLARKYIIQTSRSVPDAMGGGVVKSNVITITISK
jgi:hypothetical protein